MNSTHYNSYSKKRLKGHFGKMGSWALVLPHLLNKKVLDVGCSNGLYLEDLSSASIGIEQISDLVEAGKNKGLNIIHGDVMETLQYQEKESFEGVLFSHVMEHLECPIISLQLINNLLKKNGVLAIGLPLEHCLSRDIKKNYYKGTHLYSFSILNTKKLLQDCGFEIEEIYCQLPKDGYFFSTLLNQFWNAIFFPFKSYFSSSFWIIAKKI